MDIDPLSAVESAKADQKSEKRAWLNPAVAITVALLATFMGICKVKDDNIVQAMQQAQAEKDQTTYDALNFKDDQFDLSDALIAIAISLLAVASLTQLPWLFILALVPSGFGVLMGLSGLIGWGLHPDALIKLLS